MKTTQEIVNDSFSSLKSSGEYYNETMFFKKNDKWFSEEEIRKAISKVQDNSFIEDDGKYFENDLLKELFGEQ